MSPDYNITPFKSSEESPDRGYNLPPVLGFEPRPIDFTGPLAHLATAVVDGRPLVGAPMPLDIWADDDARALERHQRADAARTPPVVTLARLEVPRAGHGDALSDHRPKMTTIKGGKPIEPYSGKASTTVTFSEPGDYMLHVTANDYSGNGGGGSGCCWTTAIVKVSVKGGAGPSTTGQ